MNAAGYSPKGGPLPPATFGSNEAAALLPGLHWAQAPQRTESTPPEPPAPVEPPADDEVGDEPDIEGDE